MSLAKGAIVDSGDGDGDDIEQGLGKGNCTRCNRIAFVCVAKQLSLQWDWALLDLSVKQEARVVSKFPRRARGQLQEFHTHRQSSRFTSLLFNTSRNDRRPGAFIS